MTWTRYPANTWGLEAMPIDAACMKDLVLGNLRELAVNSPFSVGHFWINGAPTSTSTTYDDASTVWRSPRVFIRPSLNQALRKYLVKIRAYMDADTGSVRFTMSNTWRIVAATPVDGDIAAASSAGAVTSTSATSPTEITLNLTPRLLHTQLSTLGSAGGDGRRDVWYRTAYLTIQAIAAATRTITVQSFTVTEVTP